MGRNRLHGSRGSSMALLSRSRPMRPEQTRETDRATCPPAPRQTDLQEPISETSPKWLLTDDHDIRFQLQQALFAQPDST